MRAEWPLVGRAGELRRMQRVPRDTSGGLVIAGAPGVGKTRLASEYLASLEADGVAVVRISGTQAAAHLPLGAFSPVLPADHHDESGQSISRTDLLRRCAASLKEAAGDRPLVLFVDEAHWLDDTSATLVHQMAVTRSAFVVATIRTAEAAPDPIVAFWRADDVERIEVAGLTIEAVEQLLHQVLGGAVDRAAAHRLVIHSQGNVLFLRELVLGALDDGTLRNDLGIWRLQGQLRPSTRLTELVEARLREVGADERRLLEILAFGEALGSAELVVVGGAAVADQLERQGLLASGTSGRRLELRLGHPVYGDVLRAKTPALRTREYARLLAEAAEATGARRRDDSLRIATWRLEAGGGQPDRMLAAARIAQARYDFGLAERLAGAAVEAGAGFDARLLVARLAGLQGRNHEVESQLSALMAEAVTDRERALVSIARLDNLVFHLGRIERGLELMRQAMEQVQDPVWRDELTAKLSSVLAGTHGPAAAAGVAEPLLERESGRALAWSAIIASWALGRMGRLSAAAEAARRGRAAHLALDEPIDWHPWMHLFFTSETLLLGGDFAAGGALALEQYQQAVVERSPEAQAWFAWLLSKHALDRGLPETAAVRSRESAALFRQLSQPQFQQYPLVCAALALSLAGRPAEAEEALREWEALGLPASFFNYTDDQQARAWTAVAAGDQRRAHEILREAADTAAAIGDAVGEAALLHGLARLGCAGEVAERLDKVAATVEGELCRARAFHGRALAGGDPQGLEEAATAFERLGAGLLAAEASAHASAAWRRAGDPRRAVKAELRANTLAGSCEQPVTPALQAVRERTRLTAAERHVAVMAAAGRSNKDIAAELELSVRTVENHLQRTYEKLGISSRAELQSGLEGAD
jgi:DNA-binding CsgD family transcriptional regulator